MNVTGHILATNFFSGLFENRSSKILFMAISIVLILAGLALSYSIIWYERFGVDAKRTLINRIYSLQCWTAIVFLLLVTLPEWIRFIAGPGSKNLCWIHLTLRNCAVTNLILFQTGIIISRYAYIFWLKNPGGFHDDFWCRFIHVWVNFCSFLPHFVFSFLPGRQHIGYHICTGGNPALDNLQPPKFNYFLFSVWLMSLLVHITMSIRIFLYKYKSQHRTIAPENSCVKKTFLKAFEKNSLPSFSTISEPQSEIVHNHLALHDRSATVQTLA